MMCWRARKLLPASQTVDLTHHVVGNPLKREFQYGFEYSDCRVDDSRLVVLNALDAAEHGAVIRTRTRCTRVERRQDWELVLSARGRRDVRPRAFSMLPDRGLARSRRPSFANRASACPADQR